MAHIFKCIVLSENAQFYTNDDTFLCFGGVENEQWKHVNVHRELHS